MNFDFTKTIINGLKFWTKELVEEKVTSSETNSKSYTDNKISEIDIPPEQIQSDWNQTNISELDYIKNKPILANGEIITTIAKNQIKIGDIVYTINEISDEANYIGGIYSDNNNSELDTTVYTATFSPDGTKLVLGGSFTGGAKIYSVFDNTITYINDIYADNNGTALDDDNITATFSHVTTATFSPDGTKLVLGGYFEGYAKLYSIEDNTITYINDIYADNNGTALDGDDNMATTLLHVATATFSPDGTKLVLGGYFKGGVKIYSVESNTITYISDIKDNNNMEMNPAIIAFSPDGTKLVLSSNSTEELIKLYTVEDNIITYISNIKDNEIGVDPDVTTIAFSPDGTKLVLGGHFEGYAKLYSVEDNIITYISDIENNNIELSPNVTIATFSPDGTKLVIGGEFTGRAKIYSIEGNTITYISNISNIGTGSNMYPYTAAFSPDGTKLVLGGNFTSHAKLYILEKKLHSYISSEIIKDCLTYSIGISQADASIRDSLNVKVIQEINNIQSDWNQNDTSKSDYIKNKPEGLATEEYVNERIDKAELILPSSTEGSTKKFKITIDDDGILTATEIVT